MKDSGDLKKNILIVEDENIVALDMRYRLEAFGYSICAIVANGEAALRAGAELRPDLVLMDISLKGPLDGIETARRLGGLVEAPIVFVTAFTDEATLEKVKRSDAYGYIVKPYNERELRIAIELALSKHRYERELKMAKEAAEASDKAKSRFLSNISHELKTPLNAILGFVDLAASLADGEMAEYIAFAERGARKLETIIDSILDYTKLEFGGLAPIEDDFELERFLASCWLPFAQDAEAKGLAPRLYLDPDLPEYVRGDEDKLGTIVRNLIDNAVKFTDSGYAKLSAERLARDDGVPYLSIKVIDSGRGMTAEESKKAFAPFTQLDDSNTRVAGGLGLGLALAKGLAELLGIGFAFDSEPGRGTSVELMLPLPADRLPRFGVSDPSGACVVGVIGDARFEPELALWAPRLGFSLARLEPGHDATGCDALLADGPAWETSDEATKARVMANGAPKLILVGAGASFDCRDDSILYLDNPPRVSGLLRAIGKASETSGIPGAETDAETPTAGSEPPSKQSCHEGSSGRGGRNYQKLVMMARREAELFGVSALVEGLVESARAASLEGSGDELLKLAKSAHDRSADAGALACANLALAILMDARMGLMDEIGAALTAL